MIRDRRRANDGEQRAEERGQRRASENRSNLGFPENHAQIGAKEAY